MGVQGRPNEQITRLVNYLKEANGGILDGSEKGNRMACHTMIQRMAKAFPNFDPEESLKRLIDAGKKDPFHGRNLTNFKYLLYHGVAVIESAKRAKAAKQGSVTGYDGATQSLAARIAARKAAG
mgnify:CR=1 FL=1